MAAAASPVDGALLRRLAPAVGGRRAAHQAGIIDGMGDAIGGVLVRYGIDTPLRAAHFLAQVAHESDGFSTTEEYASGRAYEGRRDLGNVQPGDGVRFKGRGLIQLTGRTNYGWVGRALGLPLTDHPDAVNDPHTYLLVSCEFWKRRNLVARSDADDLVGITRAVNGGLNGLDSRRRYLAAAKRHLAEHAAAQVETPKSGLPVLRLGSEGEVVALLQQALAKCGYPIGIDGLFGHATALAIQHLQAGAGLDADGIVGARTWAALTDPATASSDADLRR